MDDEAGPTPIAAAAYFEAERAIKKAQARRDAAMCERRLRAMKLPPPKPPSRFGSVDRRSTYKSPPDELIQKMYRLRKNAQMAKHVRAASSILPVGTGQFTYPTTCSWAGKTRFPPVAQHTQSSASFYSPQHTQGDCLHCSFGCLHVAAFRVTRICAW